jgi:cytochrome c-type biogenesis protein
MLSTPLLVGAFVAGLGMFLAPCTLPLVPGYLAFIAGGASASRAAVLRNAIAYVVGFSVVFILLGTFAVAIGHTLGVWRLYLPRVAGAITILFGLTMLGVRIPWLSGERHLKFPKWLIIGRPESSFLIGALFALGWSPCIGPILGTILFIASGSANALSGAILLAIFSLGMGLPFILCALLMDAAGGVVRKLSMVTQFFSTLGGVVLVALGVLMLFDKMGLLVTWGFSLFDWLGYSSLLNHL